MWQQLFAFLAGLLTARDLRAAGAEPIRGAAVTTPISGTGYDVAADREAARARLREACVSAMAEPKFQPNQPKPGDTHCNQAVRRVAEALGCYAFTPGMLANDQVAVMRAAWRTVGAEEAQEHAAAGGLAVAGKQYAGHGHVAIIWPQDSCAVSGSWGIPVCWLANVGKANRVMKASEAFPIPDGPPEYFIWGATA